MSSERSKLTLLIVVSTSSICALILCVCLAYFFFFDKFFYGKSTLFGYGNEAWIGPQEHHNSNFIKNRKRDVIDLFSPDSSAIYNQAASAHLRVAIIGDSMAYGLGVMEGQSFPRILEKKLKEVESSARVWNVSIAGDHILDTYAKYLQVTSKLNPEFIFIGIVDNDLFIDQIGKYGNEALKNEIDEQCPVGSESKNIDLSNDPNLPPHEYLTRVLFPTFMPATCNLRYLDEVLGRMEHDKEKILFFTYSYVDEFPVDDGATQEVTNKQWANPEEEYDYKERFMMSVYLAHIRTHGFKVIKPEGSYEHVSQREAHPSVRAHEHFATVLFNKIVSQGWLNSLVKL